MTVVLQHQELVSKVGKDFIGRVVSVTGEPLDGKGPIAADAVWPVFNTAPPIVQAQVARRPAGERRDGHRLAVPDCARPAYGVAR